GDVGAARAKVVGGLLADLARADQQHAAAAEVAEDLLRERRDGRGDGRRAFADRGLVPDAFPDVERLPEDTVEQRPGGARLVCSTHLAEDLALARDERVEPGGDAEEVSRGRLVAKRVEDVETRERS